MKIITWYEVEIYTNWWTKYDSRAFNSLEKAKQEAESQNNAIIRKRKKIIWGKYEKIKCGK